MVLFTLAIFGAFLVIVPQLLTIKYHWLRYRNRMRYAGVKDLTADMAYEGTTENIRIEDRWNNLRLQMLKKYSMIVGVLLMALSLILSFLLPYQYFTLVFDIVFGSILWLVLERLCMSVCFKNFYLRDRTLAIVAVAAPFLLFALMLFAMYMLAFMYPVSIKGIDLSTFLNNLILR